MSLLEPLVRKAELSRSEIQILIDLLLNKQQSSAMGNSEWIEVSSVYFFIVPICKKGDKTDCSNCTGISLFVSYIQNFIQHPPVKVNCICRGNWCPMKLVRIIKMCLN